MNHPVRDALLSLTTVIVAVPSVLVTGLLKVREKRVCSGTSMIMELEPYAVV